MDRLNILPLLGLALRGGNLAVGEESVETAAQGRNIRLLLLAAGAPENTRRRAERFARTGQCLWAGLPFSKEELGHALGRGPVAMAALTDTGLAEALGRKLASLDPEAYGELAERLAVKVRRARERKAERESRKRSPDAGSRELRRDPRETERKAPPGSGRTREAPGGRPPAGRARQEGGSDRPRHQSRGAPAGGGARRRGGTSQRGTPKPYAHSRPVKKGKGSFRKREDSGGNRR